jgi:hypothetical protein
MPRICWTPARLLEARDAVKKHGNAGNAAAHLSKKWGRGVTRSQVACALRDAPADAEIVKAEKEYQRRMASDVEPLPGSFLMPGSTTWDRGEPDRQKKQEYNAKMGHVQDALHGLGAGELSERSVATYISNLAEDERRFVNRRRARAVSIALARETLATRQFLDLAGRFFRGRIQPAGYARKTSRSTVKRAVTLHLSDLHIGAKLHAFENPESYAGTQESRRLAWVVQCAAEFKTQYRDHTTLNLLLNGDVIEGLLMHNAAMADGAPMAEQEIAFLGYLSKAIGFLAGAFPSVLVVCEPGNHGRDKLIHEGRATSSKWNGHEWKLFKVLEMMACDLKNVRFSVPKAPAQIVPVFDKNMLVTHGDTELALKDPLTGARQNEKELNRINANLTYGARVDLLTFGHFHQGAYIPYRSGSILANGALVPANGHARSMGFETRCGQYLFESVPGFIVGDNRFLEVGPEQDRNSDLDRIIRPFTYESEAKA